MTLDDHLFVGDHIELSIRVWIFKRSLFRDLTSLSDSTSKSVTFLLMLETLWRSITVLFNLLKFKWCLHFDCLASIECEQLISIEAVILHVNLNCSFTCKFENQQVLSYTALKQCLFFREAGNRLALAVRGGEVSGFDPATCISFCSCGMYMVVDK